VQHKEWLYKILVRDNNNTEVLGGKGTSKEPILADVYREAEQGIKKAFTDKKWAATLAWPLRVEIEFAKRSDDGTITPLAHGPATYTLRDPKEQPPLNIMNRSWAADF
jgi:hypothetical protein